MAKIVLVRQSKPHFEQNFTHPLGLMFLAAYLREKSGHEIAILDNRIEQWSMDELVQCTLDESPDLIGLTALTIEAPIMYEFSRRMREHRPEIPQVVGGVHATCFGERLLEEAPIDLVAIGEGEITFERLVDSTFSGGSFDDIPGIVYRKDDRIVTQEGHNPVPELDDLPFPAYDLIPVSKYFGKRMGDLLFSRPEQMSIYTSRSCPYGCIYCHNVFGKGFRARSAEKVFEEIALLHDKWGIREIHIQDDIFNLEAERAKEIFRRIIDSKLDLVFSFPNGIRGDLVDEELLDLMKAGGVRRIAYAIESGSPRLQKMIGKNLNLEKLRKTVHQSAKRGFFLKGFFMLGFPTETREEMEATARFARELPLHVANFSRVIPLKGTRLYQMAQELGKAVDFDYDHYVYDYSPVNLSAVEDGEFEKLIRKSYLKFVLQPLRLLRLAWRFPNKKKIFPFYFILFFVKLFTPKKPREKSVGPRESLPRVRY
jgi:radical SAM superfamily enzyme YgiQ (UPF0313 family)